MSRGGAGWADNISVSGLLCGEQHAGPAQANQERKGRIALIPRGGCIAVTLSFRSGSGH